MPLQHAVVNYPDLFSHLKNDLHEAAQIMQMNTQGTDWPYQAVQRSGAHLSSLESRVLIANRGVSGKPIMRSYHSSPKSMFSESMIAKLVKEESSTGIFYSMLASRPLKVMTTMNLYTRTVMLLVLEVFYVLM